MDSYPFEIALVDDHNKVLDCGILYTFKLGVGNVLVGSISPPLRWTNDSEESVYVSLRLTRVGMGPRATPVGSFPPGFTIELANYDLLFEFVLPCPRIKGFNCA